MSVVLDVNVIVLRLVDVHEVIEIWQDLAVFNLQLHSFDLCSEGPEIAATTAQLRRRHATDSCYVHLTQRLETTLWTLG